MRQRSDRFWTCVILAYAVYFVTLYALSPKAQRGCNAPLDAIHRGRC